MTHFETPSIPLNENGLPKWRYTHNGRRSKMIDYRPMPVRIVSGVVFAFKLPFLLVITMWAERGIIADALFGIHEGRKFDRKLSKMTPEQQEAFLAAEKEKWQQEQTPEYRAFMGW